MFTIFMIIVIVAVAIWAYSEHEKQEDARIKRLVALQRDAQKWRDQNDPPDFRPF